MRQFGSLHAALGQLVCGVAADHAVDDDVSGDVPQPGFPLSATVHMLKGRMQQFVGDQAAKLIRILLVHKFRVEPHHTAIRGSRVDAIGHPKLCEQSQGAKKRMVTSDAHQRSLQTFGDFLCHA